MRMKNSFLTLAIGLALSVPAFSQTAFVRFNQAGYLPMDRKIAIVLATQPLNGSFTIRDATSQGTVLNGRLVSLQESDWASKFTFKYKLDFSTLKRPGLFSIVLDGAK